MAQEWICKQENPPLSYAEIYKFRNEGGKIYWDSNKSPINEFEIIKENREYTFALNKDYFLVGSMYMILLDSKNKIFSLNNISSDFRGENTRWTGSCKVETISQ